MCVLVSTQPRVGCQDPTVYVAAPTCLISQGIWIPFYQVDQVAQPAPLHVVLLLVIPPVFDTLVQVIYPLALQDVVHHVLHTRIPPESSWTSYKYL